MYLPPLLVRGWQLEDKIDWDPGCLDVTAAAGKSLARTWVSLHMTSFRLGLRALEKAEMVGAPPLLLC